MKLKTISEFDSERFDKKVSEFIKNKNVIKITTTLGLDDQLVAFVLYEGRK